MEEHLSKGEFLAHIGPMREDIKALVELQRTQNGRVSRAEVDIAVLKERTPATRLETNGLSAVISGVISGLGVWLSTHR